jgi:molybdopterin converting factor small subunit
VAEVAAAPDRQVESATRPAALRVGVRYFAAARAAAGVNEEHLDVHLSDTGCTVGDVLEVAIDRHGAALRTVLDRCSFLLDERAVHGRGTTIRDGQVLDVLPPFAGG